MEVLQIRVIARAQRVEIRVLELRSEKVRTGKRSHYTKVALTTAICGKLSAMVAIFFLVCEVGGEIKGKERDWNMLR